MRWVYGVNSFGDTISLGLLISIRHLMMGCNSYNIHSQPVPVPSVLFRETNNGHLICHLFPTNISAEIKEKCVFYTSQADLILDVKLFNVCIFK